MKPSEKIISILDKEKAKKKGEYRIAGLVNAIKNNFYNKCYLCGSKYPTSMKRISSSSLMPAFLKASFNSFQVQFISHSSYQDEFST